MQNLESVALMMSEKRCLDMTDRGTDMAKSIFLVALINVSFDLLHTNTKQIRRFSLFNRKQDLKIGHIDLSHSHILHIFTEVLQKNRSYKISKILIANVIPKYAATSDR